jgi:hypothetical protein
MKILWAEERMTGNAVDWGRILRGETVTEKYPRWLRVLILLGGIFLSWSLLIKAIDSLL